MFSLLLYRPLQTFGAVCKRALHAKSDHLSSAEIRRRFLDFFASNNHMIVPSSSVIPKNDPSLTYVNAGMNQFKNVLLGKDFPVSTRVANSQKCIRAGGKHNDLDEVGHDGRHHTFFEMLGNWSFGDYFQREACQMAFTLLTEIYRLPTPNLFFTYFGGDPELELEPDFTCREIWRSLGIPESHIIPLSMDDNFWAMGEEGPCGPCTEIHYSKTGKQEDMVELWNLVFMCFERKRGGKLEPLGTRNVDTGMGLERLVTVLQEKGSNYDTDLFVPLLDKIPKLAGSPAYQSKFGPHDDHLGLNTAYRILADHARMATVAIADGMLPERRGAAFILRKVLRRAALTWINRLKTDPVQWAELVPVVVESLGSAYPEIAQKEKVVKEVIVKEVEYFKKVYFKGKKQFEDIYTGLEHKMVLPASKMFDLSVNGVPEEVIFDLAKSRSMTCDLKGFYLLLDVERDKPKKSAKKSQPATG